MRPLDTVSEWSSGEKQQWEPCSHTEAPAPAKGAHTGREGCPVSKEPPEQWLPASFAWTPNC